MCKGAPSAHPLCGAGEVAERQEEVPDRPERAGRRLDLLRLADIAVDDLRLDMDRGDPVQLGAVGRREAEDSVKLELMEDAVVVADAGDRPAGDAGSGVAELGRQRREVSLHGRSAQRGGDPLAVLTTGVGLAGHPGRAEPPAEAETQPSGAG